MHRIGRHHDPLPDFGLARNNLLADGTPNPATVHGGVRVEKGCKFIVTRRFRTRPAPQTGGSAATQGRA